MQTNHSKYNIFPKILYFGSVSIKMKNVFFKQNANQPQQIQYFLEILYLGMVCIKKLFLKVLPVPVCSCPSCLLPAGQKIDLTQNQRKLKLTLLIEIIGQQKGSNPQSPNHLGPIFGVNPQRLQHLTVHRILACEANSESNVLLAFFHQKLKRLMEKTGKNPKVANFFTSNSLLACFHQKSKG